jgi:hypothetical protein
MVMTLNVGYGIVRAPSSKVAVLIGGWFAADVQPAGALADVVEGLSLRRSGVGSGWGMRTPHWF